MDEVTRRRAMAAVDRLVSQLLRSLADYEAAKKRFSKVTLEHQLKHGAVMGEQHAAGDRRRKVAIVDCDWHGSEISRYSGAISALVESLRYDSVVSS